jgi:hypothetical protein
MYSFAREKPFDFLGFKERWKAKQFIESSCKLLNGLNEFVRSFVDHQQVSWENGEIGGWVADRQMAVERSGIDWLQKRQGTWPVSTFCIFLIVIFGRFECLQNAL